MYVIVEGINETVLVLQHHKNTLEQMKKNAQEKIKEKQEAKKKKTKEEKNVDTDAMKHDAEKPGMVHKGTVVALPPN